ncbi:YybH family protein [Chenggangzhangella methanolivorans]|uniref:DUF4440 domain-containing protein n=1 Tax=Chenggangzhangella methanolivorans TaxID=1437009 RepID=A0A9E6RCF2_9HYPH|nr:DUF4440 domain-containing protein [Chenggangzhangella methanolivorans]QZO01290.1 DUF4440 domain-containing protein [Chenggangzhangella methanolivorans]
MTLASFARSAVLAGALAFSGAALAETSTADVQGAADKWDAAYNGGKLDDLSAFYSKDAVLVTNADQRSGADIKAFFAGLKEKGFDGHKITVQSVRTKGDVVVATGRWEMTGPSEGGQKKTFSGNWINVLEKQDGGLKTLLHTWN